jgi:hypothetical protein
MNRNLGIAFVVLVVCNITACNLAVEENKKDQNKEWSYELSENGCSTGPHVFSSKKDYCSALLDDELNTYCAYDMRIATFKSECPEFSESGPKDPSKNTESNTDPTAPVNHGTEPKSDDDTDGGEDEDQEPSNLESINLDIKMSSGWTLVQHGNFNSLTGKASGFASLPTFSGSNLECFKLSEALSRLKLSGSCQQSSLIGIINKSNATIQLELNDANGSTACKSEAQRIKQGEAVTYEVNDVPTCSGKTIKKLKLSITN